MYAYYITEHTISNRLFYGVVSSSDYIASNARIVGEEAQSIGTDAVEAVVA
jgi:hypothetical protein